MYALRQGSFDSWWDYGGPSNVWMQLISMGASFGCQSWYSPCKGCKADFLRWALEKPSMAVQTFPDIWEGKADYEMVRRMVWCGHIDHPFGGKCDRPTGKAAFREQREPVYRLIGINATPVPHTLPPPVQAFSNQFSNSWYTTSSTGGWQ